MDIAEGKILQSFPVGDEPEGVEDSTRRQGFYVTSEEDGTVAAIDLDARKVLKIFEVGRRPRW